MIHSRLVAVPLGIAALVVGGGVAYGDTIVGSPTQSNSHSNTGYQGGVQQTGGGVVVGPTTQTATGAAANTQANGQQVGVGGAGSTLVGSTNQQNSQGVLEQQANVQLAGSNSGIVVGSETQAVGHSAPTLQGNAQGSTFNTIVGAPLQGNNQYHGASQGIVQTDPGVIVGALSQGGANVTTAGQANAQTVGDTAATVVVGSPTQTNAQTTVEPQFVGQLGATGTIVGATTQAQLNVAGNSNTSTAIIV